MNIDTKNPSCSFCGKQESEVDKLIVSPSGDAYICNECIAICDKMIEEAKANETETQAEDSFYPRPLKSNHNLTTIS